MKSIEIIPIRDRFEVFLLKTHWRMGTRADFPGISEIDDNVVIFKNGTQEVWSRLDNTSEDPSEWSYSLIGRFYGYVWDNETNTQYTVIIKNEDR